MYNYNYFNQGNKYFSKGEYSKALRSFKKQIEVAECKEAWLNMGNTYRYLDNKLDKAIECYTKACDPKIPFAGGKKGDYDFALSNLGLGLYAKGDDDSAIELYEKALSVNPLHYDSIWNYALALLRKHCSGETVDLQKAWQMYEFRFKKTNPVKINAGIPFWQGGVRGERIVVLAEQGMGDKIMFGRYLGELRNWFDSIVVQCPAELDSIYLAAGFEVCKDPYTVNADYSIPICGLASIFGTDGGDAEWLRGKFDSRGTGGVLVEWQGSTTHSNNHNRSCLPGYFTGLGISELYNCRPDSRVPRGIKKLETKSWKDTAEIINGVDLVISVDTSLVHMAGSLGVECWMLQPLCDTDFRWGRDCIGESNIWYPSVKVIRNPGSWDAVFARVKEKLSAKNN